MKKLKRNEDGKIVVKAETKIMMYIGAIVFLVVGLLLTWN